MGTQQPRHRRLRAISGLLAVAAVSMSTPSCADVEGHGVLPTIPVADGVFFGVLAIDPAARILYAATTEHANGDSDAYVHQLMVIDLSTHTITATIPLPHSATDIAVDPGARTVHLVSPLDRQLDHGVLTVVDGSTNTIRSQIEVGSYAARVAVDESTHTAYVLGDRRHIEDARGHRYSSVIGVVPQGADAVSSTVPASVFSPNDIAVDPVTKLLYLAGPSLESIDPVTQERKELLEWSTTELVQADFDKDRRTLRVLDAQGGVDILDTATGELHAHNGSATPPDPGLPRPTYEAAFDTATNRAYIMRDAATGADQMMSVDLSTDEIRATRSLTEPRDMVMDPVTRTIYVLEKGKVTILPAAALG